MTIRVVAGIMGVGIVVALNGRLEAEGCPPYSAPYREERVGSEIVVRCRCVQGFIRHGNGCEREDKALANIAWEERGRVEKGEATDCEAFARVADRLAEATYWDIERFVSAAGRVLAKGVRHRTITLVEPAPYFVPFGDTGFRPAYVEKVAGNQVRHYIGYFVVGVKLGGGAIAEIISDRRERGEPGDYQLGIVAANLGARMKESPQLLRGIGGAIRTTVCR